VTNLTKRLLTTILLSSIVISLHAANPVKEKDGRRTQRLILEIQNSPTVPWGEASRLPGTTSSILTSRFKSKKPLNIFSFTENKYPEDKLLDSYQSYSQDGRNETDPHKLHRLILFSW